MRVRANLDRRAPVAAALGLTATLLSACAQQLPQPVCPASAQAPVSSVRVMVSFKQPTEGVAPETIRQLQAHGHACATHLSSVSPTVHVYVFAGLGDAEALRQKLRAWPAVLDVVPDDKAKAQKAR